MFSVQITRNMLCVGKITLKPENIHLWNIFSSKILLSITVLEQTSNFNSLEHQIIFGMDNAYRPTNKINKFQYISGNINRTLQNMTRSKTKLKFFKTKWAVPMLVNIGLQNKATNTVYNQRG